MSAKDKRVELVNGALCRVGIMFQSLLTFRAHGCESNPLCCVSHTELVKLKM